MLLWPAGKASPGVERAVFQDSLQATLSINVITESASDLGRREKLGRCENNINRTCVPLGKMFTWKLFEVEKSWSSGEDG